MTPPKSFTFPLTLSNISNMRYSRYYKFGIYYRQWNMDSTVADNRLPWEWLTVWLPESQYCRCTWNDTNGTVNIHRTCSSAHGDRWHSRSIFILFSILFGTCYFTNMNIVCKVNFWEYSKHYNNNFFFF